MMTNWKAKSFEDELKKYSWFESFEVVEEPYDWRGKVIPNYVFKIKEYSEDWGDDINELYDEIDFIFTMWSKFKSIITEATKFNYFTISIILTFNGIGFVGRMEYLEYPNGIIMSTYKKYIKYDSTSTET